jgi:hypothetical protein
MMAENITTSVVQLVQNLEKNVSKILIKNLGNNNSNKKDAISRVLKYITEKLCLLETNDSEFHRLELVKELKSRIIRELELKSNELFLNKFRGDNQHSDNDITILNNVKKELIERINFKQIEQSILKDLEMGVNKIIQKMEKTNTNINKQQATSRVSKESKALASAETMSPTSSLGWKDILSAFNNTNNKSNNGVRKKGKKKKKKSTTILFQAYSDDEKEDNDNAQNVYITDDDNDGDSSNCSSHFSFSNLPAYDTIPQISKDMSISNPIDTRIEAWDSINEFSPGDLLHSQFWQILKEGILNGLMDPDPTLQKNYIALLQKMYKESPPVLTGEIYLCLLSHLTNHVRTIYPFKVIKASSDRIKIDLKNLQLNMMIEKFEILNKWQLDIPKHWLYYPDDLNDQIIVGTLNLLRLIKGPKTSGEQPTEEAFGGIEISAFDLIALVDPAAEWFLVWIGRSKMCEQLVNFMWQTGFIQELAWRVSRMCPVERVSGNKMSNNGIDGKNIPDHHNWSKIREEVVKENNDGLFRIGQLRGYRLLHTLAILGRILLYAQGRRVFEDPRGVFVSLAGMPPPRPLPSSIALPETIVTTPIRATNNLIRAIIKGAAWIVVSKADAEATAEAIGSKSPSNTLLHTIGWWNKFDSNTTAATIEEHITLQNIIATYIQYLIFHAKRSKLKITTIDFLYLSQWQLHIDTLEDILCDIATKPKIFTYNHIYALVCVFVTFDSWTSVGKAIAGILGQLFEHTTGESLYEAPWMNSGNDEKFLGNNSPTLDLLIGYLCKKMPNLHEEEQNYQRMLTRLLEAVSSLFYSSHTMNFLTSNNHNTLCRMMVLAVQNQYLKHNDSNITDKTHGNENRNLESKLNTDDDGKEYSVTNGLCLCLAQLSISPLGLNILLSDYRMNAKIDYQNSLSACSRYINGYLGDSLPELYDNRLGLCEHVMTIASTQSGCRALEKEGTVRFIHDALLKLLNDPNGVISKPLMLHRPPDECPYMNSLLQIVKVLMSSSYMFAINDTSKNSDMKQLQDFIIWNLLFGKDNGNNNNNSKTVTLNYEEWRLIGINIVQSMVSNLNNALYLENEYQLIDKLTLLQDENKITFVDNDISNPNNGDALPEGVTFVHAPVRSKLQSSALPPTEEGSSRDAKHDYIIDANTIGYQDLIGALTRIGGPSDRGICFLPKTRDLTTPYRVPLILENSFGAVNIRRSNNTGMASNIELSLSKMVKDDNTNTMEFFRDHFLNSNAIKEILDEQMPLKRFCERFAKKFRGRGGMWRDWIDNSMKEKENSIGYEFFIDNSAQKKELEALIQRSNFANNGITYYYRRIMERMLNVTGKTDRKSLWIERLDKERKIETSKLLKAFGNHAAKLSIDYGIRCGLIEQMGKCDVLDDMTDNVCIFLQKVASTEAIDWFSFVIHLTFFAQSSESVSINKIDGSMRMLKQISQVRHSIFVWPAYSNLLEEDENSIVSFVTHLIICILEKENIEVVSAIRMNGFSLHRILSIWISQCFVNYLNWVDILHYINFSLFLGMDYQVYFIIALLDHLKESIKIQTWNLLMGEILLYNPLYGAFDAIAAYPKMRSLEKKYGNFIVKKMNEVMDQYNR